MTFYETLYSALRCEGIPEDRVLLLGSRAAGRRLLTALADSCGLLAGVRAETPYSLAVELCAPLLSRPGAPRLMNEDEARELMLSCVFAAQGAFNRQTAGSLPAIRELRDTLRELDMEEVPALAGNRKLLDLQALRERYAEAKEKRGLLDRADLFKLALGEAEGRKPLPCVTLPTVCCTRLERRLIEALAGEKLQILDLETPGDLPLPRNALGEARPAPLPDNLAGRVRFTACRGMDAEVHEALRDILRRGYPLEDCALVCLSADYGRRVYEAAGRYGLPVTLSSGVSIRSSALYMALRGLADWPAHSFEAERLHPLLEGGGCLAGGGPRRLSKALEDHTLGWGDRARYLDFVARYQEDIRGNDTLSGEEKDEALGLSEGWKTWLSLAFDLAEPGELGLEEQRSSLLAFLNTCGMASPLEAAAVSGVRETAARVSLLPEGRCLLDWVLRLLEDRSILAENARPGALFCLPLSQALFSGRKRLYVLGLGRDCFVSSRESAVLLDAERRALGEKPGCRLALSREAGEERLFRFRELLLHYKGELILSYPDFETTRQLDLLPSPEWALLREALGADARRVSLVPEDVLAPEDPLLREEVTELLPLSLSPASAQPAELKDAVDFARDVEDFVFSASSMEQALKCPLVFYLNHILRQRKASPPAWRLDRWLPKNVMGTLCHRVLELYYDALAVEPPADAAGEEALLEELFREEWKRQLREYPPGLPDLVERDEARALGMIRAAVAWTKARGRTVLKTEESFGMEKGSEPVTLTVGKYSFLFKGSIDRVDRLPDGSYGIVDYKTGDPDKLKRESEYHLQHFLYREAEAALSGGAIKPGEAGYLLLEEEPEFLTLEHDAPQKVEALLERLRREDEAVKATPYGDTWEGRAGTHYSCETYCVYRDICPGVVHEEEEDDD